MDLSLLDDSVVRDNLLILAARDNDIASNLLDSLAAAVAERVGGMDDVETVEREMNAADELTRLRISAACDLTMAVGYAYAEIYPLMATFGFSCKYDLTMTGQGRMVLMGIQAGYPPALFQKFLQNTEIIGSDEGIDWDSLKF